MEWIPLTSQVAMLKDAINCGVVRGRGGKAIVIDTGIGDRSGRHILQALRSKGLEPVAVLNTHAHGDHAGGNAYLVREAGVHIYAPEYDATVIQQPTWGTFCLFGGEHPARELSARKFTPTPSPVYATIREGTLHLAGTRIQAIHLPGHTRGHTGYLVDGVLFLGDMLAGEQELAHAPPYVYSVSLKLQSLERLESLACSWYVPAHSPPRRDISTLIEGNREIILSTFDLIRTVLRQGPAEASDIVRFVCRQSHHSPRRITEFLMMQATIHSHISHLHNTGQLDFSIEDGRLLWQLPAEEL